MVGSHTARRRTAADPRASAPSRIVYARRMYDCDLGNPCHRQAADEIYNAAVRDLVNKRLATGA